MTNDVPKAILYSWPTSVWSTVPRLCLAEKGYSDDEYVIKQVDITKGENFAPSYLKINMNGTIPTLVVPTIETTGSDVATRFRSLRDTITICDFLDQARGAHTNNTTSDRPAPALSPATIEGKARSDEIVAVVHLPAVDPNFLQLACRSSSELAAKKSSKVGKMLNDRKDALERHVAEAKTLASESVANSSYEQKAVSFLEEKQQANNMLWDIYNGRAGKERDATFYEASSKAWSEGLPDALAKLETLIVGVYALGDQVSLADFHVVAWLSRLIDIAGGSQNASGVDALESQLSGKKVGPKVKDFWGAWIERESFKKVYSEGLH